MTRRADQGAWFDLRELDEEGGRVQVPPGWWERAAACAPDPVAVLGPGWEVLWVSPAAVAASGLDPAAVLGGVLWDVVPGTSTSEEPLRRAARTGTTTRWEARIGADRWYDLRATPVDGLVMVSARSADERRATAAEREAMLARTQVLLDLSEALSATRTLDEVAAVVVAVATDRFGADYGGLSVIDTAGRRVRTISRQQLTPDIEEAWADLPLDHPGPAPWVCRTGQELLMDDIAEVRRRFPDVAGRVERSGLRSGAIVPLVAEGVVVGALTVAWTAARSLGGDTDVVRAVAGSTAQAVRRAVLLAGRTGAAEVLQRALLPLLPDVPGVELVARYLPAGREDHVGGDWYDAVPLEGDRLAMAVGDVAGHDIGAAAVMGRVSGALRAFLLAVDGLPSRALTAVDDALERLGPATPTTAVVGVLTPPGLDGARSWRWTNAGHPPPLLVLPDGRVQVLARPPELLLGVEATTDRSDSVVRVPPGAALLLHSDGLVERRGRDLDEGTAVLAGQVERLGVELAGQPLGALVDAVLTACLPEETSDDVVVLAVRVAGPVAGGVAGPVAAVQP